MDSTLIRNIWNIFFLIQSIDCLKKKEKKSILDFRVFSWKKGPLTGMSTLALSLRGPWLCGNSSRYAMQLQNLHWVWKAAELVGPFLHVRTWTRLLTSSLFFRIQCHHVLPIRTARKCFLLFHCFSLYFAVIEPRIHFRYFHLPRIQLHQKRRAEGRWKKSQRLIASLKFTAI